MTLCTPHVTLFKTPIGGNIYIRGYHNLSSLPKLVGHFILKITDYNLSMLIITNTIISRQRTFVPLPKPSWEIS